MNPIRLILSKENKIKNKAEKTTDFPKKINLFNLEDIRKLKSVIEE